MIPPNLVVLRGRAPLSSLTTEAGWACSDLLATVSSGLAWGVGMSYFPVAREANPPLGLAGDAPPIRGLGHPLGSLIAFVTGGGSLRRGARVQDISCGHIG
jgi:hypothetical protein